METSEPGNEGMEGWSDRLERGVAGFSNPSPSVLVYRRLSSTQDAAWRHRDQERPVLVIAGEQTHGRGRLGRRWDDGIGCTLPLSLCVPSGLLGITDDAALSARVGLATLDACRHRCPDRPIAIKWPNDIVVRGEERERKLAGVLIERKDGMVIIGIGVNVLPGAAVNACPVSLQELGCAADRCDLAIGIVEGLGHWLRAPDQAVRERWAQHDAMVGTRRSFRVGHATHLGMVRSVDPLGEITLETSAGTEYLSVRTARTEGDPTDPVSHPG